MTVLVAHWGNITAILGGYIGILETKMETTAILVLGLYWGLYWDNGK